MGMARVLSNPQESGVGGGGNRASKFISNSGAQMQSLNDLDRKSKHAVMRGQSNVFGSPLEAKDLKGMMGGSKGGSPAKKGTMGNIMSHDEGPNGGVEWPRKKTFVQGKVS